MKVVLCIGGLDPAGRAGLFADARAVAAMGARPVCVASALTFQSSVRVDGFEAVSEGTLRRQLEAVLRDEPVRAVKVGQPGNEANSRLLATLLPDVPIVVDTPLVSSSGASLFEGAVDALGPLFARATLVTPNGDELRRLSGLPEATSRAELEGAAGALANAVLVKGGHFDGARVVDVLVRRDGDRVEWGGARIEGKFRGTGCRLASAIAARLAERQPLVEAIGDARTWLVSELRKESRT